MQNIKIEFNTYIRIMKKQIFVQEIWDIEKVFVARIETISIASALVVSFKVRMSSLGAISNNKCN